MQIRKRSLNFILIFCAGFLVGATFGFSQETFHENLLESFTYRNLGPFRAGSWVVDVAVPEFPEKAHLYTFYVATRNGGLWKTENNGTTFEPIFENQNVNTIGNIALAPSNPDIIWVGTGGPNNRESTRRGDGVYKSTDGGKTWKNMGLEDTHHIGRIVIHPKNPDIVYVAACGHLFSFNQERGLFKSEDGGTTWKKSLYINEKVGVTDVIINPSNPDILYAASYERLRLPWHFKHGGPGSGIYKTTDGGETWDRLENDLPSGDIGRIGLDIYLRNPDIVYAWVENANMRPPTEEEIKADRNRGREPWDRPLGGEVYRTDNAGKSWRKMNSEADDVVGKLPHMFGQIRIDPNNDKRIFCLGVSVANSFDGGLTWKDLNWPPEFMPSMFGDVISLWIDPQNSDRIIMGSHGGLHMTYDGGKTCDFYDNLPIAQTYMVDVDMEDPYNIYGGFECHELWKGPSNSWSGRVSLEDWVTVGTSDGMYCRVDPNDSRWLYTTSEFGQHYRVDQKLGVRVYIRPSREKGQPPYRFAWNAPIHISPHNSQIIYAGAEVLLRSMNRGEEWQEISPDLTTDDPERKAGRPEFRSRPPTSPAITTISESPVTPGIIWIGTDDGKVWITKDYGATWSDLTAKISRAGAPENYWVNRVTASNFKEGTALVCKSGYRRDDFRPFVYRTVDFGETWTSISSNLPADKVVNVVWEDKKNPNLLFLGGEIGVYVSIDRGERWVRMKNNMPTVEVHDLLVHPRENDLVVGTYGRGIFITDITPLQELNEKVLEEDIYLFGIEPKVQRFTHAWGNYDLYGDRHISVPNEPNGIVINCYLKNKVKDKIKITITDPWGKEINSLEGNTDAGINRVVWNMSRRPTEEERIQMRTIRRRDPLRFLASPGEYMITLEVGDKRFTRKARIKARSGWPVG